MTKLSDLFSPSHMCLVNDSVIINDQGVPVSLLKYESDRFGVFQNILSDSFYGGDISAQQLHLPNIAIRNYEGKLSRQAILKTSHNFKFSATVDFFFLLAGDVQFIEPDGRISRITSGSQFFMHDPQLETLLVFPECLKFHMVQISVASDYFIDILPQNEAWAKTLTESIGKKSLILNACVSKINLLQHLSLQNILNNHKPGKLGLVSLECSALQTIVPLVDNCFATTGDALPNIPERDSKIIQDVKRFLEHTFLSEHTLQSIARQFGINQSKLTTYFKALFGMTIFELVSELKMLHAKELLEDKGLFVQEVSSIVGYKNPHHFSAAFKKRFGISPSALKA